MAETSSKSPSSSARDGLLTILILTADCNVAGVLLLVVGGGLH
jgi:hypothetical protein